VRAHISGQNDVPASAAPLRDRIADFEKFPDEAPDAETAGRLRSGHSVARPLMAGAQFMTLEQSLGRRLPRGPKAKSVADDGQQGLGI
jgi:hypothetical protein